MLDPGFATGGYSLVSIGGNSFASGVARLPDGRFVVAGTGADAMMNPALLAAAFTANGAPDPSFGSSGHRLVQASAAATPRSGASGLVVQPSGRIVVVGEADDPLGGGQLALVRLGPDGMLDASFGGTGVVQRQLAAGSGAHTFGSGGVFTPDGKLVVCGYTFVDPVSTWFVASFVADLPPTATFGVAPAAPVAGDAVTLDASASTDPDGRVAAVAWDLDGDGVYGDATGAVVTTTFATGGPHVVGVAVSDDDGVTATATQTLTVDCGTAATFASVGCRLLALAATVDGGVAPGKAHDRLAGDVASARRSLDAAASASGKARRHALAGARRALARFLAAVRDGGAATRALRHELLAAAKGIRVAIAKLAKAR